MDGSQKTRTPHKSPRLEQKYKLGTQLGKGQFGKVFRAKNIKENAEYAVKVIPLDKVIQNPKIKGLLKNQIEILDYLKHPNIIQFYELFCDSHHVYMVYELCDERNLEDLLPIPPYQLICVAKQIIEACAFAEKRKALHRDLKPANVLFRNGIAKVADWGFSREIKKRQLTRSFIGSPAYMAPEVLNGSRYSHKADVWSFGVMIYECYHGYLPWDASSIKSLQAKQKRDQVVLKKGIPNILKTVILRSLHFEEKERASFSELKKLFRNEIVQNPESQSRQAEVFDEDDVRRCSFYLQFAKSLSKFGSACQTINSLSLRYIIANLKQLRRQKFPQAQIEHLDQKQFATLELLNKEIKLINKLQNQLPEPKFSQSPINEKVQQMLVRKIKKFLKEKTMVSSSSSLGNLTKRQIFAGKQAMIWIMSVIDVLVFDHLPTNARETKLSETQKLLQEMSSSKLYLKLQKKLIIAEQLY